MVWTVHTAREVDAPPETVWRVLVDFDAYPEWNPTLTAVSGEPEVGATLSARLSLPNGLVVPFRPTVRVYDPERELRWRTTVGGSGAIDADHSFRIEPLGDGRSRIEQEDRFEGVLAAPILGRTGDVVRRAMVELNRALAERAEVTAATDGTG